MFAIMRALAPVLATVGVGVLLKQNHRTSSSRGASFSSSTGHITPPPPRVDRLLKRDRYLRIKKNSSLSTDRQHRVAERGVA